MVGSTVIQLVANCMDRAKHRRRKAAAMMRLRLDLHRFLPSFANAVRRQVYTALLVYVLLGFMAHHGTASPR